MNNSWMYYRLWNSLLVFYDQIGTNLVIRDDEKIFDAPLQGSNHHRLSISFIFFFRKSKRDKIVEKLHRFQNLSTLSQHPVVFVILSQWKKKEIKKWRKQYEWALKSISLQKFLSACLVWFLTLPLISSALLLTPSSIRIVSHQQTPHG